MSRLLDEAIDRLAKAHRIQNVLADRPAGDVGTAMTAACEDRDAALREVVKLGIPHLAAFEEEDGCISELIEGCHD